MTANNGTFSLPTEESREGQSLEAVFTVWGTRIRVKPAVLANLLGLWGLAAWLAGRGHPERPWSVRILVGLFATIAMMVADFGHAMAHIISARYAGAPMDEILISEGMPRTLYYDNDVPPRAHRTRALGGPIFSFLLTLAAGLVALLFRPIGGLPLSLAVFTFLDNLLVFTIGALLPLGFTDGSTILTWWGQRNGGRFSV